MGKGSGRLHDRTQISSQELENRWENTFKSNRGGGSEIGSREKVDRSLGFPPEKQEGVGVSEGHS